MSLAPIFALGAPRSGTTVFFEVFGRHQDLAWPSNYTERFPRQHGLNFIRRLLDNRFYCFYGMKPQYGAPWYNKYLFRPGEAYDFWNTYSGLGKGFSRGYLLGQEALPEAVEGLNRATESIRKMQGRERFSCKLTGPSRLAYLNSVFPNAYYVHIIRHGKAVTESLMRVPFWKQGGGFDGPYWDGGFPEAYSKIWQESHASPGILTALQWRTIIEFTRQEAQRFVPKDRYIEIRYEDFVADPVGVVSRTYEFCGLDVPVTDLEKWTGEFVKKDMNRKSSNLSAELDQQLGQLLGDTLAELGYLPEPSSTL